MAEQSPSEDGLSGVEQDEESFLSCQIPDQSLGSSRQKSDSESASYVSCLSKNDSEKPALLTRDGATENMQTTSGQNNDGCSDVTRVVRHASLIPVPLRVEEKAQPEMCPRNFDVRSSKTNNQTADVSHKNVSENTDGEKEEFNRNRNLSIYDNAKISGSQSCGSLLSVPNQRSMTDDNARCFAPRRNRTGLFISCYSTPSGTSTRLHAINFRAKFILYVCLLIPS